MVAGKQLDDQDEHTLFNDAIDIIDRARPRGVMIETVRGFLDAVFHDYRERSGRNLTSWDYTSGDAWG